MPGKYTISDLQKCFEVIGRLEPIEDDEINRNLANDNVLPLQYREILNNLGCISLDEYYQQSFCHINDRLNTFNEINDGIMEYYSELDDDPEMHFGEWGLLKDITYLSSSSDLDIGVTGDSKGGEVVLVDWESEIMARTGCDLYEFFIDIWKTEKINKILDSEMETSDKLYIEKTPN